LLTILEHPLCNEAHNSWRKIALIPVFWLKTGCLFWGSDWHVIPWTFDLQHVTIFWGK
jgi:hypothetical protein